MLDAEATLQSLHPFILLCPPGAREASIPATLSLETLVVGNLPFPQLP